MRLQSCRAGQAVAGAVLALLLVNLGGCKIDPTFGGEKVRCETDAQCEQRFGEGFECYEEGGYCVRVEEPGEACLEDEDCEEGFECQDGWCGRICEPDCRGGYCVDGECMCEEECSVGEECQLGECGPVCKPECRGGYCIDGECICEKDCPVGEECQLGACGAPCEPPCHEDGLCFDGECECLEACGDDERCHRGRCVPAACDIDCPLNEDCAQDEQGEWYCAPGPLAVEVDSPEQGAWVPVVEVESFEVSGRVYWMDDGEELLVTCSFEGGPEEGDAAEVFGHEEINGVSRSYFTCTLDLSDEEAGEIEVSITAETDRWDGSTSVGTRSVTVRRDVAGPRIGLQIELGTEIEGSPGVVYVPQTVTAHVEIEDFMTEDAGAGDEPDGEIASAVLQVFGSDDGDGLLYETELTAGLCEQFDEARMVCAVDLVLGPDIDPGDLVGSHGRVVEGEHQVHVTATDAAGNTSNDLASFEVSRTPVIEAEVIDPDRPQATPGQIITVRRDGRFRVEVGLERPEQVALDEDDSPVVLVEIRKAVFDGEACGEHLDLSHLLELEDGTFSVEVSAMEPCLSADVIEYDIAVLIEDKWLFDPSKPKSIGDVICEATTPVEDPNMHCESFEITRHVWDPIDLCDGLDDDHCEMLTPAVGVDSAGNESIYVAVNYGSGIDASHKMVKLETADGVEKGTWEPADWHLHRGHLRDGPVLGAGADGTLQAHLWSDITSSFALLFAVEIDDVDGAARAWQYPPESYIGTPPTVKGLPAVGYDGRLYVPISRLGEDPFGQDLWEGAVVLLGSDDGQEGGDAGGPPDFISPTSIAVLIGGSRDWGAVIDSGAWGGKVHCNHSDNDMSCSGGTWQPHMAGSDHPGDVAATQAGYLAAFSDEDAGVGNLCLYPWGPDAGRCFEGGPMTTGPVYHRSADDTVELVVGTLGGLLFLGTDIGDGLDGPVDARDGPPSGPVRSLSLDAEGTAYAIIDPDEDGAPALAAVTRPSLDQEPAEDPVVPWKMQSIGSLHDRMTPILAEGGTSYYGDDIGILYIAAGGKLHALITDAPPAPGWPNIRGCPARQSAMASE